MLHRSNASLLNSSPAALASLPATVAWFAATAGVLVGNAVCAQEPGTRPVSEAQDPATQNPATQNPGATSRPSTDTAKPETAVSPHGIPNEALRKLIADTQKAHFPNGDPVDYQSYRMGFKLSSIGRNAANIEVVAETTLFPWERRPGDMRTLIRTRVFEGESPVERGWDQYGAWQRQGGKTESMMGDAWDLQKAQIRKDINLGGQLLRYLNPGAVLSRLADPSAVTTEDVPMGRGRDPLPCRTVSGRLNAFPLYYLGGEEQPAQIQVWVDDTTGRLVAVEATPIVRGDPNATLRERYRLSDYELADGVLVPRTLVLYRPDAGGRPRADVKVMVSSMELDPKLAVEDLMRPK